MSQNVVTDDSNDKKYFVQIPQIVLALCRNPYDFTLWTVIKMIAGEYGTCKLATPDLAALAMMSVGKVSDSRAYLLQVGLLEGSCYRETNYPQPVWHLRVPDIWLHNITWRQLYDGLKDRVELKTKLKALFEEADIYRRFDSDSFQQIDGFQDVNVKSLHNMKPSQYEKGVPQNEKGISQNERKKNHIKPIRRTKKESAPESPPPVQKPLTPSQQLFSALADVCRYDLKLITGIERGQLNQTEKIFREAGHTPADIQAFSKWWYANDWRGQKKQPPTIAQIRQVWGQFKESLKQSAPLCPAPDSPLPESVPLTPEEQILALFKERAATEGIPPPQWREHIAPMKFAGCSNGKIQVEVNPFSKEILERKFNRVLDPIAQELTPGGFEYVVT